MKWRGWLLLLAIICSTVGSAQAEEFNDYLYYRDVNVPPYQKLREFFDMPDRPGTYEVTLLSDAMGPLTFRVLRVREEHEQEVVQRRSYRLENHEFQITFPNRSGKDDLIVEIANSNPALTAKISVYVVELR